MFLQFRVIPSYWSLLKSQTGSLLYSLPDSSYNTTDFRKFSLDTLKKWSDFNKEVLNIHSNVKIVFYENLIKDPVFEVAKIVSYLGIQPDPKRLECLLKYPDGPAKRNHSEIDPYKLKDKKLFATSMFRIIKLLQRKNVEVPKEYFLFVNKMLTYSSHHR
ncbi:UNVERIFIED_CONTAM: hypothetical protein RMT77_001324 [Armadillidium vulgare]